MNFKHNSQSNWGATYYRKKQKLHQDIMIYKKYPETVIDVKKSSTFKKSIFTQPENAKIRNEICPLKIWIFACFYILKIIMDNMQHTILQTFKVEENLQK